MPKTRSDVGRAEKVEAILDAAEVRLLAGGYLGMSVAGIARDLDLAQNSLHWYFGSKDELFVAVLRRMLPRLAASKPPGRGGVARQILWGADQLQAFAALRTSIRERAGRSELVAAFEGELDGLLHGMLVRALTPHVDADDLELAARTLMATVEGTLAAGLPRSERHRVIRFAMERLT